MIKTEKLYKAGMVGYIYESSVICLCHATRYATVADMVEDHKQKKGGEHETTSTAS